MPRWLLRSSLVVLASALALGVAWRFLRRAPARGVVDDSAAVRELLEQRARESAPAPSALAPREPIAEDVARKLFPQFANTGLVYDPDCYFRYAPAQHTRYAYAELPGGGYWMQTNALGLREDEDPAAPDAPLEVLACGDSHTDGVCANADSWPNRLEAALGGAKVWNAGCGGYSFYHYQGVLERFAAHAPRVYVVAVYGGNDFVEVLRLATFFGRKLPPDLPRERRALLERAAVVHEGVVSQALTEAAFFEWFPEQCERARALAVARCLELDERCRALGTRLVLAYVPSALEVQRELYRARVEAALEVAGIQWASFERVRELAQGWRADLHARGLEVLDLGPVLAAVEGGAYWFGDLHLNLRGNQAAGAALAPLVRAALAGGAGAAQEH